MCWFENPSLLGCKDLPLVCPALGVLTSRWQLTIRSVPTSFWRSAASSLKPGCWKYIINTYPYCTRKVMWETMFYNDIHHQSPCWTIYATRGSAALAHLVFLNLTGEGTKEVGENRNSHMAFWRNLPTWFLKTSIRERSQGGTLDWSKLKRSESACRCRNLSLMLWTHRTHMS